MCRKLMLLTCVVLALSLLNGASAVERVWTNDGSDGDWCYYRNWSPDEVPGAGDTAWIDQITYSSPNRGPIIGMGCDADVGTIQGPNPAFGNTQVVDVNGNGTVEVTSWMWRDGSGTGVININGEANVNITNGKFRGTDNGVSILNISGDPTVIIKECAECDLRGGDGSGSFYINMSGGYLKCGYDIIFGDNGGGELNLSGGSIFVKRRLRLGTLRGSVPITVNMTPPGGLLTVKDKFELPSNAARGGNVRLNLYAGTIDCNELVHGGGDDPPTYTDDWRIDIEEGVLKLKGNVTADIDANVAAGQITAYEGDGTVVVELIDGNTVVTASVPDPNTARRPNPSIGGENVEPDVTLMWLPGINAVSHNVYLGTDFDDVDNATTASSVYKGNYEPNEYDDPCDLEIHTTYYWRIDEVNAGHPHSPWKGRVWHFTTRMDIVDPNMRVWYKFDEPNGLAAHDSSGYGHHGGLDGPEELWLPDEGQHAGCRGFDDDTAIDVPPGVLSEIGGEITIIVWLKDTYALKGNNFVFNAGTGGRNAPYHTYAAVLSEDKDVLFRAGDDSNDVLHGDVPTRKGWHHFTFVKSEARDEMRIYCDAELVGERDGVEQTLANVRGAAFKVGAATWTSYGYVGVMDDFKVFDYALSAAQIATDYRGGDTKLTWGPSPGDYETDVPRDANLTWNPGDYAVSHDVYFGTDWDDVNDAVTVSSEYMGQQDPCEYDHPINLELNTIYYWRIDEVNDACQPDPWKGNVWQFTVANFLIIDDMESYNQTDNWISNTWLDGFENWSGAEVYVGIKPTNPARGGDQSMIYLYYNDGGIWDDLDYYSEVEVDTSMLPIGSDWTEVGVKALTLFFDGNSTNDANEQMYVVLEDTGGAYAQVDYGYYADEDVNDIKEDEWHQWDIALSDFTGVDANNVKKLYIGFGIRGNPNPGGTPGGSGIVYFDDVRLYLPKCVPWRLKPACDFTNDCKVDIADVGRIAESWLKIDRFVDVVKEPNTPVVHYEFNETSGSTAHDSTIPYYHGLAKVDDVNTTEAFWEADGRFGSCIRFELREKEYCLQMPTDAFTNHITNQITISLWVNWDDPYTMPVEGNQLFSMHGGPGDVYEGILGIETGWVEEELRFWDASRDAEYKPGKDDWSGGWNHYAFTKHVTDVNDGYLRIYLNSDLVAESDSNAPMSFPADNAWIGMATDQPKDWHDEYTGLLDDFRVYDYALSEAEIGWLASTGTGYVPLVAAVNIYDEEPAGEKAVNFRDMAKLMNNWREEELKWPE